ncbi:MAG: mechanosensitive ion channel family protein [Candidatus Berkiellales bacterium]
MTEIISSYSIKLINSLMLAIVFLGVYLIVKFIVSRRVKIRKQRSQINIRLKYAFFILFMIFFIKIWVEGFVQILAFIGFLSAAITLTQKDNLMNLVGWLIINWRGLFSEEDYIKISNFSGYVKSIGFLYFTLIEASPDFPESPTGRIIKVPNGMVARNPVINFSHEKFVECTLNYIFKPKGDFAKIEDLFVKLKNEIHRYLTEKNGSVEALEPKYSIKLRQEKPAGYEMIFLFYCKHADKTQLQQRINKLVVDYSLNHEDLALAFD